MRPEIKPRYEREKCLAGDAANSARLKAARDHTWSWNKDISSVDPLVPSFVNLGAFASMLNKTKNQKEPTSPTKRTNPLNRSTDNGVKPRGARCRVETEVPSKSLDSLLLPAVLFRGKEVKEITKEKESASELSHCNNI
jgi:hypothetical protein